MEFGSAGGIDRIRAGLAARGGTDWPNLFRFAINDLKSSAADRTGCAWQKPAEYVANTSLHGGSAKPSKKRGPSDAKSPGPKFGEHRSNRWFAITSFVSSMGAALLPVR
jgi:hypothetical protein